MVERDRRLIHRPAYWPSANGDQYDMIDAADLALLTGARTISIVQEGGADLAQEWPASVAFLLR